MRKSASLLTKTGSRSSIPPVDGRAPMRKSANLLTKTGRPSVDGFGGVGRPAPNRGGGGFGGFGSAPPSEPAGPNGGEGLLVAVRKAPLSLWERVGVRAKW